MTRVIKEVTVSPNAAIFGTGSYLPERVLTNAQLEQMVDTSDEWIRNRTGIRQRHIASEEQATSDLAVIAGQRALQAAGISPRDLDLIIVATFSPDKLIPSTACIVQHKLDAKFAAAFDLGAACTGFIYAISVASSFINTGSYQNVLVIGAETLSRFINWKDRTTCVLFADGAGAVVLGPSSNTHGILASYLSANGVLGSLIEIPAGGSCQPVNHKVLEDNLHYLKMSGRETFKEAVSAMSHSTLKALEMAGHGIEDLDWLIPHQANIRIMVAVAKKLGIPQEKVIMNVERCGNTSAASIPIALDEAVREGRVQKGHKVMLVGFGSGLTWGANLISW